MSIITTRYRDLPWDEVKKCLTPYGASRQDPDLWERSGRGRPLQVITPPTVPEPGQLHLRCGGPFYEIANPNNPHTKAKIRVVCVHIAEIGD